MVMVMVILLDGGRRTWVSVSFNSAVNSALSAIDKYCFSCKISIYAIIILIIIIILIKILLLMYLTWYFFSKLFNCWVVKGVRGFLDQFLTSKNGVFNWSWAPFWFILNDFQWTWTCLVYVSSKCSGEVLEMLVVATSYLGEVTHYKYGDLWQSVALLQH